MRTQRPPKRRHLRRVCRHDERRGAVAVEFAFVAPILLALVLGMTELTRMFEVQNLLDSSAREGARLASIDRDGMLQDGQSTNDKLVNDVKNMLASNGVPRDAVNVEVRNHGNPEADFDLDDPANFLELFDVLVSVDYSEIGYSLALGQSSFALTGKITFRNGKATTAQ